MNKDDVTFTRVIDFHGHACPGLALGYRVALTAINYLSKQRSHDEELVAIVENDSCSVDAIQIITGCTFGKGNLIFNDYGKQVYSFFSRPSGEGVRISIRWEWESPSETPAEREMWRRYTEGDRSEDVLAVVHTRKAKKMKAILEASENELFGISPIKGNPPAMARIYPSVTCQACREKVMEPRARVRGGQIVCLPCAERDTSER